MARCCVRWARVWPCRYQLGLACRAMQHQQVAEKHLRTAVLLAATSPVVPYSTLPFCYPPEARDI